MIDETGNNLGALPLEEALRLAEGRGIDLIEVAPNANPPVCRLMSVGKYLYAKDREERKKRAKERKDVIKTIRLTFGMGIHDMMVRVRKAEEFLKENSRIQIEIRLRGRQKAHPEVAQQKIKDFIKLLPETVEVAEQRKMPNGFLVLLGKS